MSANLLGWLVLVLLALVEGYFLASLHLTTWVWLAIVCVVTPVNVFISDEAERWWRNRSTEE